MAEELKPCPFCGGAAARSDIDDSIGASPEDENFGGSFIECDDCGACTRVHFDRKENLVDSWNRRAADNRTKALETALKPFAEIRINSPPEIVPNGYSNPEVWREDVRRARAALAEVAS